MMSGSFIKKQMKMIEISDTFCPKVILSFIKISSDINSIMLGSIFEKKIMFMLMHCVKHTYMPCAIFTGPKKSDTYKCKHHKTTKMVLFYIPFIFIFMPLNYLDI